MTLSTPGSTSIRPISFGCRSVPLLLGRPRSTPLPRVVVVDLCATKDLCICSSFTRGRRQSLRRHLLRLA
ncbi:hypothetical protein E2562_018562 [Oryza meyeriana var. granulata]|uniref:Uncharacterized protein n=1 Tax=Oryza meyeriana var. granulata TaxID=110450 RepID=A0A6G1F979_9ORYZ|nr:hypothetical protein E2562_018562 [Oryza meyeriana var. granulata]